VEQAHVLGGLALVRQGVARERPVHRVVEAVADAVRHRESDDERLRTGVEEDEDHRDEGLGGSGAVDEDLAPVQAVGNKSSEEAKGHRRHHHHEQPYGRERVGLRTTEDDVPEEVEQVDLDHRDSGRHHEPREDDPREVALVQRTEEFTDLGP